MALFNRIPLAGFFSWFLLQYRRRYACSCMFLSFIGGIMIGYTQVFIGGLIIMSPFLHALSTSLYYKFETASTTNFCEYLDTRMYIFYVALPLGKVSGLYLGSLWPHSSCGRKYPKGTMIFGSVLVVVSAFVFARVHRIVVDGLMGLFIGVGVGLTQEVIPILPIQIAPMDLRRTIECTFVISKIVGEVFSVCVSLLVSTYFPLSWYVVLYVLVGIASLFILASISLGEIDVRGTGSIHVLLREHRRHVWSKLLSAGLSQFYGLAPRVFHGPFLLESIGLWEDQPFLAVLIGGIVGFLATCFGTFYLIPRFGRRRMILLSLVTIFLCEIGTQVIFKQWGTFDHTLKSPQLDIVAIFFMVICMMYPLFGGPHGWTAFTFPRETERAGLAWEAVFSDGASSLLVTTAPISICLLSKWFFLHSAMITVCYIGIVWLMVEE